MDKNYGDFEKEFDAEFEKFFRREEGDTEASVKEKPGQIDSGKEQSFRARFVRHTDLRGEIEFFDALSDYKIGSLDVGSFRLTLEDWPGTDELIEIVRFVDSLKEKS